MKKKTNEIPKDRIKPTAPPAPPIKISRFIGTNKDENYLTSYLRNHAQEMIKSSHYNSAITDKLSEKRENTVSVVIVFEPSDLSLDEWLNKIRSFEEKSITELYTDSFQKFEESMDVGRAVYVSSEDAYLSRLQEVLDNIGYWPKTKLSR